MTSSDGAATATRALTIARFRHVQDNRVQEHATTWPELKTILTRHLVRPKKEGPLWSPTRYQPGTTRGNKQVDSLGALVLDFDHGIRWPDVVSLWERWEYVIHTTHNHTDEAPRWRAVFPLARDVLAEAWLPFWRRAAHFFGSSTADPSCKEPARIYYLPSHPPGVKCYAGAHEGLLLDPDELPALPPEAAPSRQVSRNGKRVPLGRGDYRTLDAVALFRSRGHYGRAMGGGKHAVLCPWYMEHSEPDAQGPEDSDTVIWEAEGNQWPNFDCKHAHCDGRRMKDVIGVWDADAYCAREYPVGEERAPMPGEDDIPPKRGSAEVVHEAVRRENAAKRKLEELENGAHADDEGFPTLAELLGRQIPQPKWIIEGLIPEGVSLLFGKPKMRKSWLAFGTALAVCTGGRALGVYPVQQRDVLYLALEDAEWRLQDRLRKMGVKPSMVENLYYRTKFPRFGKGGEEKTCQFLDAHPDVGYVIYDTYSRVKPPQPPGCNAYEHDSASITAFTDIAQHYHVAILVIHHQRKAVADDWIDSINGSSGLAGSSDTLMMLQAVRGEDKATLRVTGKDVETEDYHLTWQEHCWGWVLEGTEDEWGKTREQHEILEALRFLKAPSNYKLIHRALADRGVKKSEAVVKRTLYRMAMDATVINHGDGFFGVRATT
jgi:AAA domain-containing protein